MEALVQHLREELGEHGVLTGDAVSGRMAGVWRSDAIVAPVILRPASTAEVATVLRVCNDARQPVITHGGLTGLVEGAIAGDQDFVLGAADSANDPRAIVDAAIEPPSEQGPDSE